jgi:hypothetical protein
MYACTVSQDGLWLRTAKLHQAGTTFILQRFFDLDIVRHCPKTSQSMNRAAVILPPQNTLQEEKARNNQSRKK